MDEENDQGVEMQEILQQLGLANLILAFEEQKVTPNQVVLLSEPEFKELGVVAIGDRIRLKEKCREILSGSHQENLSVAQRVLQFQNDRKKGKRRPAFIPNSTKCSRRIQVGWKHRNESTLLYRQVTRNKGGGVIFLDVVKNDTMLHFKEKVGECFFPGGVNMAQNMELKDLDWFIANFLGIRQECFKENRDDILVSEFLTSINTSPVRVYLHTQKKYSEDMELPDELEQLPTKCTSDDTRPTCSLEQQDSQASTTELSTTAASMSSPLFTDADTPTVQFRQRRSLSLNRRYLQGPSTSGTQHQRDVIEIVDSEDEDLQKTLFESLSSTNTEPNNLAIPADERAKLLKNILRTFQEETVIDEENVTKLLVLRSRILETTIKGLDRKAMNFRSRLYIKFAGESGEDLGGPRREFFRLVFKALHESRYFEGADGEKVFTRDLSSLAKEHYRLIGRLVAMSLAQGGPGIHFMSPELFDLMVGKETDVEVEENLLPEETKSMIHQLRDADTDDKEDSFLVKYGDQLLDLGIPNVYRMARVEKETLIQLIMKNHIFYRISAAVLQFTNGMNDVNKAWDMVKSNSELFKDIFCCKPRETNGEQFLSLFKTNFSEQGSNNRTLEDISVYGWELFLQSIEAGEIDVTLPEVLAFITGADRIPPCGFSKDIDIDFYSSEENRLPSVSTCTLQLWLPRVSEPDEISKLMIRAVKESCGFLKI